MKRRSVRDVFFYLLGRRARFLVSGKSMLPTLQPEVSVFVDTQNRGEVGDVVVLRHPHQGLILIKRLHKRSEHGVWVLGDNPAESTDSRHFGWVQEERVLGKVRSFW